jgi:Ca2+-transporting ATPase
VFKDKNLLLWLSFVLGMGLQFFVIFTPGVNTLFKVYPPEGVDWAWVFGLAFMPLVIHEIAALVIHLRKKANR